MNKTAIISILALSMVSIAPCVQAQPRYDRSKLHTEQLNRGTVAVRSGNHVVVSWRVLPSDAADEAFDVYRNGKKLNAQPLTKCGSFFIDEAFVKTDP